MQCIHPSTQCVLPFLLWSEVYSYFVCLFKAQHTLGNIVAGNKVAGKTQCMVMMGPETMLLRIDNGSIRSNIVAGPITLGVSSNNVA